MTKKLIAEYYGEGAPKQITGHTGAKLYKVVDDIKCKVIYIPNYSFFLQAPNAFVYSIASFPSTRVRGLNAAIKPANFARNSRKEIAMRILF